MSDISKVTVEAYEVKGAKGYIVAPESEMKKVVIPSPPTVSMVPINPRECIIYLSEAAITPESACIDAVKTYAVDNKAVIILPEAVDAEAVVKIYEYAIVNAKTLNIKKDAFSIKADEKAMDATEEIIEALEDADAEVDEVEVLTF